MFRRWLLGSVAVAALASGLFARPGIVTHRDGSTYTGDVSEDEQGKVTVKVHGIPIVINRADVVSIRYVDDEDFPKKLASLPANDFKSRMDLAKWALGERKYDWAIQAADAALKVDPNSAEATDLITTARRQREMERNHPAPAAGTGTTPAPGAAAGSTTAPAAANEPRKTLTADDINTIRQCELSDKEDFRVQFNNDVRRKYCDLSKQNLAAFTNMPVTMQAREIMKNAPEMRNDVRIMSDPGSITTYRQKVQPVMMQGCATAGCHSGNTGAGFVMINTAPDTEANTYTNFFILTQYHQQIGNRKPGMIERTTPQRSLLLQYGLPLENADPKHPDVQNYHPIFRTPNDPRFLIIAKWLGEQLQVPAPDYSSIKYEIPSNASSTPATQPSK